MDKYTKHRFFTALVLEIRASLFSTLSDAILISKFSPFSETHRTPCTCCKVCSAAGGHIKKLEILPRLHFERAKSAERYDETRKQSDAILKIQHSGGTGTSSCLVHKVMNYQIDKKQKQTNRVISYLLQSYFFFNYLYLNLACFVSSFFSFGGVMGCGEQVTNWHYFIQSSFVLHSLHF